MTRSTLCKALLLSAVVGSAVQAQTPTQPSMQEIMNRSAQVATPGPQHAALAHYIGQWDVEISFTGAMMPAQRSKGTAEYFWIIEGRWLGQRIKAQLMGRPYESFSIRGYDNLSKSHVALTLGTSDTSMNVVRGLGTLTNDHAIAMYGTLDDYLSGQLHKPYKVVARHIDDNRHISEVWEFGANDTSTKVMEFIFSRAATK
jgi:hypothetical protein